MTSRKIAILRQSQLFGEEVFCAPSEKTSPRLEGNQKAVAQRTSAPPDDAAAVKLMRSRALRLPVPS